MTDAKHAGDSSASDNGYNDPLAVTVGLGVGSEDLPCDGWPTAFKRDVALLILGYLPGDD